MSRIAFVNSWRPTAHEGSGTAVGIDHLARGLERLGHQVDLHAPRHGRGPLALRRLLFNLRLGEQLDRRGPYDLVVGFDVDGVFLSESPPSPFVLCLKGVAADEARFADGLDRLDLGVLARIEAWNARKASLVVVPSRYSAAVAMERYGVPARVLRVIPEPIDPEPWARLRADPPPRPRRPTILSVARQYPRKDTATLLRAVARLRERIPEVQLRVIGGGPELPRLRALAAELALHGMVRIEGAIPDTETVRRAYFESHVFCLPSRQEGFGIVFLEAMAAGLPVVAARAAAVPEVVADGRTGLLVPPGDPVALAEALFRILDAPDEAARMGEAGLARVRGFHVDVVARRFLEVVEAGRGSATPGGVPEGAGGSGPGGGRSG